MRRLGSFALCLALLWLWMAALGFKWGAVPPMGRFMSPFAGFWRNAEGPPPGSSEAFLDGLSGTVVAEYDRRGVPHVFAPDLQSLFYAQGYATARDRLWQMDIQSRAGMGRLSEVMGPGLLRFDLERRRMGMPSSAVSTLEYVLRDSLSRVALEAYAQGVNAWISSLKPATYPLEFKLLDYAPEAWTPLKSIVMLKNMQWTLSQGKEDVPLTKTLDAHGRGFFSKLYPQRHPGSEPILPEEIFSLEPKNDSAVPAPQPAVPRRMAGGGPAGGAPEADTLWPRPNPASGSNNFVISGKRTRSGYPILANDPHLDLTLPSLWYEIQLKSGDLNAYGVSLPGLPGIVIGFTRSTAWGLTNGMDDVFDWFELKFQNDSLNNYAWKSRWRPTYRVLDTILVRGGKAVVDTQLWSHLGPVPVRPGEKPFTRNTPPGHGLKWTALDPSNELGVFLRLLTAEDARGFRRALRGLQTPSQNVVFANREEIALAHQGRIPVKKPGQGRLTVRGTVSAQDWHTSIPQWGLPWARNPARGWLASANQEAAGPRYPWYLGSEFYPPERSQRLHRLLVNDAEATLPSAWGILRDDYSRLAARALPLLLRHLPPAPAVASAADSLPRDTTEEARAAALLRAWDYRYGAAAAAPVYFDLWWKLFYRATWLDDFDGDTTSFAWPSRPVTLDLLADDSASIYFDDKATPRRETAGDLARATFARAVKLAARSARPDSTGREVVSWGAFRPLSIPHLLRLAPLGVSGLAGDGCGECLNAQRGSHGPSWRMAVQIGKRPEAWGIYPGGQSGNPGSRAYDAFIGDWLAGRAYRLLFLNGPLEVPDSTAYLLTLWSKR